MTGTSGPTNKSGTIATSETWGIDESPFHIIDDVSLSAGVEITIEPGVEIEFQKEGAQITLVGTSKMFFGGTKELPIWVHGQAQIKDYWLQIVTNGTGGLIKARYTTFENSQRGLNIDVGNGLWLEHCILRNNKQAITNNSSIGKAQLYMNDCDIHNNLFGLWGESDWERFDTFIEADEYFVNCRLYENEWAIGISTTIVSTLTGKNLRFYRNRRGAIHIIAGSPTLTFEECWWGNDSGPTETGNVGGTGELILDDGSATLDYTPFTRLGQYVPIVDDLREFVNRILREGTPSGVESLATIVDDDELGRFLRRAERTFDSWHTDEFLENTLFGYGEETNEARDRHSHDVSFFKLRYRPIIAISSLQRRTGTSSWTTVNENELSGYYSSEPERRQGQVFLALITTLFERDTIRVTYTHGYPDIPEEIRDIVIKIAALEAFQAILRVGEEDVFADRLAALQAEIEWSRDNLRR